MLDNRFNQLVTGNGINKAGFTKVRDQWSLFLEGKQVDSRIIPKEVIDSWTRSKNNGVDPYALNSYPFESSRKKELDFFHDTLQKYHFFFKNVLELIDPNDYSFSFGTKDGVRQLMSNKIGLSFPGFIGECSEKTVGTNSNSIAINTDKPTILLSPYFYRQDYYQNMNSVAAPIHNEKKEVIGSMSLGYFYPEKTAEAFTLISFITKVFDSLYIPLTYEHDKQIQQIVNCLPQGLVYLGEKDNVKFYNEKLLDLLKIDRQQNIERQISKHLPKLGAGVDFVPREAKIEDQLSARSFRLIQLEEKIRTTIPKYETRSLKCDELFSFDQIVGNSALIKRAKAIANNVANTEVPVILYGESGTGKEMFAQAIHNASNRREQPFVAINCGALPSELVESELFGYEEGSFTGALRGGKTGKIEAASGGTLFLDEIESMPLKDQIKLLRFLSTGKVQKVGSNKEKCVDVRLISATKTDLLKEADNGLFREDLFFRISTFIIELPPLRERKEDIILLTNEFLNKLYKKYDIANVTLDELFVEALKAYSWRGNVRELEHAIERSVIIMGGAKTLLLEHLSDKIQEAFKENTTTDLVHQAIERSENNHGLLELAEKMVIEHVLNTVDGNVSAAAEQLGINRRTIYNKIQRDADLKIIR